MLLSLLFNYEASSSCFIQHPITQSRQEPNQRVGVPVVLKCLHAEQRHHKNGKREEASFSSCNLKKGRQEDSIAWAYTSRAEETRPSHFVCWWQNGRNLGATFSLVVMEWEDREKSTFGGWVLPGKRGGTLPLLTLKQNPSPQLKWAGATTFPHNVSPEQHFNMEQPCSSRDFAGGIWQPALFPVAAAPSPLKGGGLCCKANRARKEFVG